MLNIEFNQKTSAYAEKTKECNLMIVKNIDAYINDLLKIRGYVYANEVYQSLGVEWNPEWENICILANERKKLDFHIYSPKDEGFMIHIG